MVFSPVPSRFTQEGKAAVMATANVDVVLDNDRVAVHRVKRSGPGPVSSARRRDRLIIYLKDSRVTRTEGNRREEIIRKAGEVIWRPGSQHEVELLEGPEHEVLIIELKD